MKCRVRGSSFGNYRHLLRTIIKEDEACFIGLGLRAAKIHGDMLRCIQQLHCLSRR